MRAVRASPTAASKADVSLRRMLLPLALTQFVASFAGSSMNVSITSISKDIHTTVHGVQTAITLFLLCMAALMIPGSKLTDKLGRKWCLMVGLSVYGTGAVVAALAPVLGVLIVGYSVLEGVGSALMIPPIYILATMLFDNVESRAGLRRDRRCSCRRTPCAGSRECRSWPQLTCLVGACCLWISSRAASSVG